MEQASVPDSDELVLRQARTTAKKKIKALTLSRKNEAQDSHIEKSRLSVEIKQAKKDLNQINSRLARFHEAPVKVPVPDQRSDYAEPYEISENTSGWDEFVTAHGASHYHRLAWCEILAGVMGRETKYLVARDAENAIIGVLPIAITRSRLFGAYAVSLPYLTYGGPVAVADNLENDLIHHAFSQSEAWQITYLEIRDVKERPGRTVRTDKFSMILSLADLPRYSILLDYLGSKVRSQIKKSSTSGIKFEIGGCSLLTDFYSVFARNMRDLGTPVYSKKLFASIIETYPDDTLLVVGFYLGQPVTCGFLLNNNGAWEIPWASTIRSANKIAANMALYARVLEEVIARGADSFDFGRSSVDASTYRFKKQWRAKPMQLYWYYSSPKYASALTTTNSKYQLAIKAWQKLPLPIANAIGPALVKNLP